MRKISIISASGALSDHLIRAEGESWGGEGRWVADNPKSQAEGFRQEY